jgi:hypothetical protein
MQSVLHKVVGPKEVHPENLEGRVAVVTGGALGIGYAHFVFFRLQISANAVEDMKSAARLPSQA